MKPFCCLLLFVSTLSCAQGQRLVSIEAFKKITDPDEREKIAAQAPPQRREELANLDKYLMLTAYDKEKGTQGPKEEAIIKRRGFEYLEVLFRELGAVWQVYLGQTLDSELKAGMSLKERREVEMHIEEELDTYGALQPVVHSLVYHLATSRRALRLEEKAAELDKEIHGRIVAEPDLPPPFTDRERRELTKYPVIEV